MSSFTEVLCIWLHEASNLWVYFLRPCVLSELCRDTAEFQWRKETHRGKLRNVGQVHLCSLGFRLQNWCVMPSVKCNRPEFKSRAFITPDINPGNVNVNFPYHFLSMWKVSIHKLDYSIDQHYSLPYQHFTASLCVRMENIS